MFNSSGIISKAPTPKYISNFDDIFRKPAKKSKPKKVKKVVKRAKP